MNQAQLQALISNGMAKAASILGRGLTQYRPVTTMDPVLAGSDIGTVVCSIDLNAAFTFVFPVPTEHPFTVLLADTRLLQAGDYLVGNHTYFVSRIEPLKPAWCVLCNRTLDVLDTAQLLSAGANTYGGITSSNDTLLARGWPMSMLAKTRSEEDVTKLPSDTRSAYFEVWLPSIPGLILGLGLCLRDSNGQIYVVMSWETTAYGCKMLVGLATT